jgi:hypothetical protein
VTFTFRMRPRAFPMTVLFPLMRKTIERQVRANIERLGRVLDAEPDGGR